MMKVAVYAFTHMYAAASLYLKMAEASDPPPKMHLTTSILYCAISLEAYLNHVGEQLFGSWESLERRLGPSEKLALISDRIPLKADLGHRPFQSFGQLFKFRNSLVHSRTERRDGDAFDADASPELSWLQPIDLSFAARLNSDTRAMIEAISAAAPLPQVPLYLFSEGVGMVP